MTTPLALAEITATELRDRLAPFCERIEIAGSVRRRKPEVKDLELVAVPRFEERSGADLWGSTERVDLLLDHIATMPDFPPRSVETHRADGSVEYVRKVGEAYQAREYRGIPVDLFIVRPPAEWGVIFALRTGPGDWNTRIVTDCKRFFRRVEAGRVWHFGVTIPCPEEADFFRAVGQPWLDPWERRVDRVRLSPPTGRPA